MFIDVIINIHANQNLTWTSITQVGSKSITLSIVGAGLVPAQACAPY